MHWVCTAEEKLRCLYERMNKPVPNVRTSHDRSREHSRKRRPRFFHRGWAVETLERGRRWKMKTGCFRRYPVRRDPLNQSFGSRRPYWRSIRMVRRGPESGVHPRPTRGSEKIGAVMSLGRTIVSYLKGERYEQQKGWGNGFEVAERTGGLGRLGKRGHAFGRSWCCQTPKRGPIYHNRGGYNRSVWTLPRYQKAWLSRCTFHTEIIKHKYNKNCSAQPRDAIGWIRRFRPRRQCHRVRLQSLSSKNGTTSAHR